MASSNPYLDAAPATRQEVSEALLGSSKEDDVDTRTVRTYPTEEGDDSGSEDFRDSPNGDSEEDDDDDEEEDWYEGGDYYNSPDVLHQHRTLLLPPHQSPSVSLGFGLARADSLNVRRRPGLWSHIRSWYTPVYDFRSAVNLNPSALPDAARATGKGSISEDEDDDVVANIRRKKPQARFCGGRVSRGVFVLMHLAAVGLLFAAVIMPVMLLVVVPAIIRDKVNAFDGSMLRVDRLDVNNFTADGLVFSFKTSIPAFFPLPLQVNTGPMDLFLEATFPSNSTPSVTKGVSMMKVVVPSLSFKVSDPLNLDFTSSIAVEDKKGFAELLERVSQPGGVKGVGLRARTGLTITVFGIQWYRNLPITKDLGSGTFEADFKGVLNAVPAFIRNPNMNSLILEQYKPSQLWTFFPNATSILPLIAINSLDIKMLDAGILLTTQVTFENPSIMTLPLPPLDLGINIGTTTLARVGLKGLEMKPKLNTLNLDIWLDFLDPLVTSTPEEVGTALNNLVASLLFSDPSQPVNVTLGCTGPLRALPANATLRTASRLVAASRAATLDTLAASEGAIVPAAMLPGAWLQDISGGLDLRLALNDVLQAVNLGDLRTLLQPSADGSGGLASLLSTATFSATLKDGKIVAPVSVALPKFLPLPPEVPLNFGFGAAVAAPEPQTTTNKTVQVMTADLESLRFLTTESAIRVSVTATIDPENTDTAATALAGALNPVLAAAPPAPGAAGGIIHVRGLRAFDPNATRDFAWSNKALSQLDLRIPLPRINVSAILQGALAPSNAANATGSDSTNRFPFSLGNVAVAQSRVEGGAGFEVAGELKVERLKGLTQLNRLELDVGYLGLRAVAPAVDITVPTAVSGAAVFGLPAVTVADVEMPTGLKLVAEGGGAAGGSPATPSTLNVTARLPPKSADLTHALTSLANALLAGPNATVTLSPSSTATNLTVPDTYLGITGLVMGGEGATRIVTFRELVIQLAASDLRGVVATAVEAVVENVLEKREKEALVVVQGVDLEVGRGSGGANVGVEVGGRWGRGIGLGVKIGGAQLNVSLNTPAARLASVSVSTLKIPSAASLPFSLGLNLTLARDGAATGARDAVANLIEDVWSTIDFGGNATDGRRGLRTGFVVSGLYLPPLEGAPASTAVDQLQDVTLVVGADVINTVLLGKKKNVTAAASATAVGLYGTFGEGLVDVSRVLPTEQSWKNMNVSLTSVSIVTRSPKTLVLAVNATLTNPTNATVAIPFAGVDLRLDDLAAPVMSARVLDLALRRGRDALGVVVEVVFPTAEDVPAAADAVAKLAGDLLAGRNLASRIVVSNVVLGDAGAVNDMFGKTVLDVTPLTNGISGQAVGDIAKGVLPVSFPTTLPTLLESLGVEIRSASIETVAVPGDLPALDTPAPSALQVSASAGLKLPFSLEVDVGYLALELLLDGVRSIGISLSRGIKVGGGAADTVALDALVVGFSNAESTQRTVASFVAAVLDGAQAADVTAGVTGIVLGASQAEPIRSLQAVRAEVALKNVLTVGGDGQALVSLTDLAFDTLKLRLGDVAVVTKPGQVLGADVGVAADLPFPVNVQIGYVAADVCIEYGGVCVPIVVFELENGVKSAATGNATGLALQVSTDLRFADSEAAQDAIASLVNGIFKGDPNVNIVITNLRLGTSSSALITTFIQSKIRLNISKALKQLLPIEFPASFQTLSQQFNINLGNVQLETVASSSMSLVTSVDLTLPFRLTARLGHVSAQVSLSNARLLEFSTVSGGLNVLRDGPLMINALLGFSNGEDVQDAVAALVDSVFNRNTFGDNAVGLYGIRIGSSSEDTLKAFSKVAVNVPLKDVISLPGGEGAAPPNLGGILLDDLQLGLGAITVETKPQSTLGVELAASFKLPFPVSLKLGSVSGGLGYGGVFFASFGLDNLRADGRNNQSTSLNLATDVVLAESDQAQDAVAGLVSGIFSGSSAVANIGQINFGVSRSDLIRTFSKVKAPVELTTLLKRFVPITFPATFEDLSKQLDLGITTASIETREQSSVALDAQVNLKLPLDLTVRIGYLAVSVGISGAPFVDFAAPTGISLSTRTAQTAIGGIAAFSNSDNTQDAVASLANGVFTAGTFGDNNVGIRGLRFGASASDTIKAVQKVQVSVPLSSIVNLNGAAPKIDAILLDDFNLGLGAIAVVAKPAQTLGLQADASFRLPFPVSLKLGSVAAGFGANSVGVASLAFDNLQASGLSGGTTNLNLTTDIVFSDSDAAQDALATVVSGIFDGSKATAEVGNLAFGASRSDLIRSFAKAKIPLDLSALIAKFVPIKFPATFEEISKQLDLGITSASVATLPQASMSIGAEANVKLPLDLTVDLGFVGTGVLISTVPFVDFYTTSALAIRNRRALTVAGGITFSNSEATQSSIATLCDKVFKEGTFGDASVGVQGLRIGVSPGDTIKALQKIKVSVPLSSIINLNGTAPDLGAILLNDFKLNLGAIGVSTKPNQLLGVEAAASLNLPFPVAVSLGTVGAGFGSGGVDVASFGIDNLNLTGIGAQSNRLNLATDVRFSESDQASDALSNLVNGIFSGSKTAAEVGQLAFGYSRNDLIYSFARIKVPIDLSALIAKFVPIKFPATFEDLSKQLDLGITSAAITTQPQSSIGLSAQANLKLPLDLTVALGYIGTGVTVSESSFVQFFTDNGLNVQNGRPLSLAGTAAFSNEEPTQDALANLVTRVFKEGTFGDAAVGIKGLRLGVSASDTIKALEKIRVSIPLKSILDLNGTAPDIGSILLNDFKLGLGAIAVSTKPQQALGLQADASFNLPFPVSISLGTVTAGFGSGGVDVASFAIDNLKASGLTGQATNLNISTDIRFSESDQASDALTSIVNGIFSGSKTSAEAGQLAFGASASDLIRSFAKVKVPIDLSALVAKFVPIKFPATFEDLSKQLDLGLTSASISTLPQAAVGVSAVANLKLPLDLTVNLGYVGTGVTISDTAFLDFATPSGLSLLNNRPVNLTGTASFSNSDSTQNTIATLCERVFRDGTFGDSAIGILGLRLGVSATETIKALEKIRVSIPLSSIFKLDGAPDLGTVITETLKISIGGVDLATKSGKTLGLGARVAFDVPFDIGLKLDRVTAGVGAKGVSLASVDLANLSIGGPGAGRQQALNIQTDVAFSEANEAQDAMADLVNDVLSNSPRTSIDLGTLSFGVSESDRILSFSKAKIPVGIASLVTSIFGGPIDLTQSVRTLLDNSLNNVNGTGGIGLTSATVDIQSGSHIVLGASANADFKLPFPLTVQIGSIGVNDINFDSVAFAKANIAGLGLQTGAALNVSLIDVTLESGESIATKIATMVSAYTMANGPGKSAATLNVAGIAIGEKAGDAIAIFSKVKVAIPVDSIFGPIAKFLDQGLTNILGGLNGNVIGENSDGSLRVSLGKDLGITLGDCRVAFDPSSVIRAGVAGGLDFPLAINAKVPFVGIALSMDDTYAFDVSVSGINVNGKGRSELKIEARIGIMDSDPLAAKVAAIADAFFAKDKFPGNIVFSGLRIGASSSDTISALSKASIPVGLDRIADAFFGNVSRSIDIFGILNSFGFGLSAIDVSLPSPRTMRTVVGVKLGNKFPLTVELPYLSTSLGLDYADVFSVDFNKPFKLSQGNQDSNLDINLGFVSSRDAQLAVKKFSEAVYEQGWGKTTERLAITSLKLGYSSTDYIRAFSKARIGLPTSSVFSAETVNLILKQLGFPNGVTDVNDGKAMLDRIDIQGARLDLTEAGVVRLNCTTLLRRVPFNLKANFPYFYFNLKLLEQDFIKFTIRNLIVSPETATDLRTNLIVEFRFYDSPTLKDAVANVVSQMQGSSPVNGLFAATNILLGPDEAGAIDTISQLRGELFISRVTGPGVGVFDDMLGNLQLDDITIGLKNETTMDVSVASTLKSPLPNIHAVIPYLYLEVLVDGKTLAQLEASEIFFDDGKVKAKALLTWPRDLPTIQKAADVATSILFRREQKQSYTVDFSKLRFGASGGSAFNFVDTAKIKFDIDNLIKSVTNYVTTPGQTLELTDINTVLTEQGVHCFITGTKLPRDIPFRSLAGAGGKARVMWAPKGTIENYIVDVYFKNIYFAPNEVFSFELDVVVNAKEAEPAIAVVLPRFIQWKPYLLGVLLGHATFYSGSPYDPNSIAFTSFDQVTVVAPDLYFYDPLIVQPKLLNPFKDGLGLRINLYFANPGPLRVELGHIGARLISNGNVMGSVDLEINTKNNLQGGQAPMGNLVPIIVKIDIGDIFKGVLDLLFRRIPIKLDWYSNYNGLSAPWLVSLLDNVPEDISGQLIPIIISVLRHIEIKLGPFNFGPLPSAFNSKADEYLSMAGNHVRFGTIDAMPQAFAPLIANSANSTRVVSSNSTTSSTSSSAASVTTTSVVSSWAVTTSTVTTTTTTTWTSWTTVAA
ncbi:hypothetical protein HDU96_004282 [Phlyctochytrium bullatum]|nr:hypothetical protein HDU96_004282 [Phlyctochytrium bullatum]